MGNIKCTLLHLSDLHYGEISNEKEAYFVDDYKEYVLPQFRTQVQEITLGLIQGIIRNGIKYDGVCITGDFTFRGDESGFNYIQSNLIDSLKKLSSTHKAICCVPGNHDVKWYLDPNDKNLYKKKFLAYKNFINNNQLTTGLIPKDNTGNDSVLFETENDPIYLDEEKQLCILCINSSLRCGELNNSRLNAIKKPTKDAQRALKSLKAIINTSDISYADACNKIQERLSLLDRIAKHLSVFDIAQVTQNQRNVLKQSIEKIIDKIGYEKWNNYIKVSILHHHISPFDSQITEYKAFEMCLDSSETLRFLTEFRFDLVLTGHKHQPYIINRSFNNRNICLIGCSTIAGQPIRGKSQGFQSIEIIKNDHKNTFAVTKFPVNVPISNINEYLKDRKSKKDCHEIDMQPYMKNTSQPCFELRKMDGLYETLNGANNAKIYALTFKSFGDDLSDQKNKYVFEKLEKIDLFICSLQTVFACHPILKTEPVIEREWFCGLNNVITGLLSRDKFPNLESISLNVLSNTPILTATVIGFLSDESHINEIINYTPIVVGVQPAEIPTLSIQKIYNIETPVYSAYKKLIKSVENHHYALCFIIRRNNQDKFFADSFVRELKYVCNNPLYEIKDCKLLVEVTHNDLIDKEKMAPIEFASIIPNQFKIGGLKIKNHNSEVISLSYNCDDGNKIVKIDVEHFIAYFVLLIWGSDLFVMCRTDKDWPYDLPGGKRKIKDNTWQDALRREVFEEIGMILDKEKFGNNFLGTIYDHRSANQKGAPVIASYCYYVLNNNEFDELQIQQFTTKGHQYEFVSLEYILKEKREKNKINSLEVFTHAPEFVIKTLHEIIMNNE